MTTKAQRRTGILIAASLGAALSIAPGLAPATPVSVFGGFLGYSGPAVEGDASAIYGAGYSNVSTMVNFLSVTPTAAVAGMESRFPPVGTGSLAFAAAESGVEFWVTHDDPLHDPLNNPRPPIEERHNLIVFTPAPAQEVAATGVPFLLGTFDLMNGLFWAFGELTLEFKLTTSSANPDFDGKVFQDTLRWVSTPNAVGTTPDGTYTYTAEDRADFFYFSGNTTLGSMRVYEYGDGGTGSGYGTIDLYGAINSLDVSRFDNPTGSAFTSPSILPPNPGGGGTVPLPGTALLLGVGLAGIGALRRIAA